MFLHEKGVLKNLQEYTCAKVVFYFQTPGLKLSWKESQTQVFSCAFLE